LVSVQDLEVPKPKDQQTEQYQSHYKERLRPNGQRKLLVEVVLLRFRLENASALGAILHAEASRCNAKMKPRLGMQWY
jgi:hypothetical protein